MLREERKRKNIPLWKLAASLPFPVSNLQRIEAGVTEPRIGLAMKTLVALNVDAGSFMQSLAELQSWQKYDAQAGIARGKIVTIAQNMLSEGDSVHPDSNALFGLFFRRVRVACNLTQTIIAERANYTVRSLIYLEGGKQEPLVMRALELVGVMGVEISPFFESLASITIPRD